MRLPCVLLVLAACLCHPSESLSAQESAGGEFTVTPFVGAGLVIDDGKRESGGMVALVQLGLTRAHFRWSAYAEVRGIGVGCSDGCDRGGQAWGAGASYLLGGVEVGGGVGVLHRSSNWHLQPHGQIGFAHGIVRGQVRVEVPRGADEVHVPILLGVAVPIG